MKKRKTGFVQSTRKHISSNFRRKKIYLQKRGLPRPSTGGSKFHCNIKLQNQPINTFASHFNRQLTIVRNFNMLFIVYHWPITDLCQRLLYPRRGLFRHCGFQRHTGPLTKKSQLSVYGKNFILIWIKCYTIW